MHVQIPLCDTNTTIQGHRLRFNTIDLMSAPAEFEIGLKDLLLPQAMKLTA
jgi:hypothetical protein